jgi:Initiator Replication protein
VNRTGKRIAPIVNFLYASDMNTPLAPTANEHPTLKTPQELIHIQHRITLRQYKYWILMLRAYREAYENAHSANDDGYYMLSLTTLAERMGYRPSNAELRADLEAIRKEPIIYNALCKDGTPAMRGAGFISTWQIAQGHIGFSLPEMLCRSVEQLDDRDSIFHLLNWSVFSTFSGKHEANLYKLCKDYVGVRRTPLLTVQTFRDYMGISEREYPEFKALNRYVIADPIKRINESAASDITIEVAYQRSFRKITSLQFLVQPKNQASLSWGDDPAFSAARALIPVSQQREYLLQRSAEAIKRSIDGANVYIDELTQQGKSIRNAGGIYRKAILEDWGAQRIANVTAIKINAENKIQETINRNKTLVDQQREFEQSRAQDSERWATFMSMHETTRNSIVELVVADKKLLRRQLNESGLESAILRNVILQSSALKKALLDSGRSENK